MFVMSEHGYLFQIVKRALRCSFRFSRTATEQALPAESKENTKQGKPNYAEKIELERTAEERIVEDRFYLNLLTFQTPIYILEFYS